MISCLLVAFRFLFCENAQCCLRFGYAIGTGLGGAGVVHPPPARIFFLAPRSRILTRCLVSRFDFRIIRYYLFVGGGDDDVGWMRMAMMPPLGSFFGLRSRISTLLLVFDLFVFSRFWFIISRLGYLSLLVTACFSTSPALSFFVRRQITDLDFAFCLWFFLGL
jgi:hypothetical protein